MGPHCIQSPARYCGLQVLFAQKIYRAVEKIIHTENGTKTTEINIHTSRKYIKSGANILLGFSIIKNAHYKKFGKRKKRRNHSRVLSPRENHGEYFHYIFFKKFYIAVQKNLFSYIIYTILFPLEQNYYTEHFTITRGCTNECYYLLVSVNFYFLSSPIKRIYHSLPNNLTVEHLGCLQFSLLQIMLSNNGHTYFWAQRFLPYF